MGPMNAKIAPSLDLIQQLLFKECDSAKCMNILVYTLTNDLSRTAHGLDQLIWQLSE